MQAANYLMNIITYFKNGIKHVEIITNVNEVISSCCCCVCYVVDNKAIEVFPPLFPTNKKDVH